MNEVLKAAQKHVAHRPRHRPAKGETVSLLGLPRSVVINFAALFTLFAMMAVLSRVGHKSASASVNAAVQSAELKPELAPTPVAQPPPAAAQPEAATALEAAAAPEADAISEPASAPEPKVATAPESEAVPEPQAVPKPAVVFEPRTAKPKPLSKHIAAEEFKEIPVEDLDNESARQHYIAANKGISASVTDSAGSAIKPSEITSPNVTSDFIPFERRSQP